MKQLLQVLCFVLPLWGFGQNDIATGTWRTHYSYNNVISIAENETNIYGASNAGVFIISKADNSITSLTKLNGLSDTGIAQIGYNTTTNTLVIAYKNGQVDLLNNNTITSIPNIRLSNIIDSKVTHHIYSYEEFSYLSSDFGVVQIDTENLNIKDSYLNLSSEGKVLEIYASTISNGSLFLATEKGIMAGSLTDNLKDFTQWKRFGTSEGIDQQPIYVLSLFDGKPISGSTSTGIITYENGMWTQSGNLIGEEFLFMKESDAETMITTSTGVYNLTTSGLSTIQSEHITIPAQAIKGSNTIWIADQQNGVLKLEGASSESIYPSGPFFSVTQKLKSIGNKVFALPEFKTTAGAPLRNNQGFSVFEDGFWANYNSTAFPNTLTTPEFLDISGVSSFQNATVFSSYGYGLLVWEDDGSFNIVDETNSSLVNSLPPERNVLLADIDSNNQGLWVLNNNTTTSLQLWETDRTWSSFSGMDLISGAEQIVSTPWGDQWMAISSSAGGIHIFNEENGELTLSNDGEGTLPSNTINDILLDKEDKIWVATTKGIVYYASPYTILNDLEPDAITPIIDNSLLFNQENVNALAVDGGNRIWMGTNKGAWLFDKDGSVLIEHFTAENSPLLSDVVLNITINDQTGEVFFNTDEGLISYRGSGTITGTYEKPKIFPNPVPPNFSGVVTIEGLPYNSSIKITDASGRLVANLEANGNTAVWDMKSEYLLEVGTGVYFVFASLEDGTEKQLGKIAIVK